jgi:hypothetical protein
MGVPLPPQEFVEAYEIKKNQFTKLLNIQIQMQLNRQLNISTYSII